MSRFKKIVLDKAALDSKYHAEIVNLHQQYFSLDAEVIIELLKQRDEIHLYYDTKTNQLIATIGIQWIDCDDFVIMYLGNAVVEKDYQKYGVLTMTIYMSVLKTLRNYRHQEKYCASFATTPEAYKYFKKFKNFWPKPEEKLPEQVTRVMEAFSKKFCSNGYTATAYCYKSKRLSDRLMINANQYQAETMAEEPYTKWFYQQNPDYRYGEQILCMVAFDKANFKIIRRAFLRKFWSMISIDTVHKNKKTTLYNRLKLFIYVILITIMGYLISNGFLID